jgi:hypothetical protein
MEMAGGPWAHGTGILRGLSGLILALGASAAPAQEVNLTGRILEKAMRKPVPGAMVRLAGDPSVSFLTGPDGRFRLIRVPNGAKPPRLSPAPEAAAESRDALGRAPLTGFAAWARKFALPGNPYATSSGPSDPQAAAKASAPPGSGAAAVEISRTGLLSRTVEAAETIQELGDIALDYPARKVGVGTPPPYGSFHVFDGTRATLDAEWEHWMGTYRTRNNLGPTPITWTFVEDPVDPGMTMRTCCRVQWGDEDLVTKRKFRDFQAHVEFNLVSAPRTGTAAGPANSGVYLQSLYEIQIKDDYGVSPLGNHDAGAILNEFAAPENLGKPRGQWQAYDITFRAARFKDGVRTEKARLTLHWNGKKVHTNRETANEHNVGVSSDPLTDGPHCFKLQSEGHDVRFRNVWIKELDIVATDTDFGY